MIETDQERIARLERKVEALETYLTKVAPILKAAQEAHRKAQNDPYTAIENLLRGKRG